MCAVAEHKSQYMASLINCLNKISELAKMSKSLFGRDSELRNQLHRETTPG